MRSINKFLACLLFLPCCAFAINLNDYFQQGISIDNHSKQSILVSDQGNPEIQNYPISVNDGVDGTFASDQFTIAAGQTFNHTIIINSAVDNSLICTVTSSLYLDLHTVKLSRPTSSDPTRCATGTYMSYGSGGQIYGFNIEVMDPQATG